MSDCADNGTPLQTICTPEGALQISIGEDILAWAAFQWAKEEAFEKSEGESTEPDFVISDPAEWARDVARELMREDEAGVTLLTRLFDKAFEQTLSHGSCAITANPVRPHDPKPVGPPLVEEREGDVFRAAPKARQA